MKSSGNKIPQVSLSSVVTNKDLVSFPETESLALADITLDVMQCKLQCRIQELSGTLENL